MATFETSEYQGRIARTKTAMQTAGVDVLLAVNPANMCYLTGYDGWSFYVHQLVIVADAHDQAIWVGREMDANAARVTSVLEGADIVGYPDDYVQSDDRHPMDFVADLLVERGLGTGTIGVEMDAYYFTAAAMAALVAKLPNAHFQDCTRLVGWVRAIKSAPEIALMQQAARIVERTMQVAYDTIAPGVRQCDAAAAIYQAQISGTPEYGGDYTALCPMLPTGAGTSTPHLTWTDQPFVRGEATILELAGARHRYHCPMARTLHLGPPPLKLADAAKVVIEGLNAALDAARPGVRCEAVEAAWRAVIAKHGIAKNSRIGYSTGLAYPPDWGEHTLSLRPGDTTELQTNMTIHMIPGIWLDDWGIEISECFRVTETGARRFCEFPQELYVRD